MATSRRTVQLLAMYEALSRIGNSGYGVLCKIYALMWLMWLSTPHGFFFMLILQGVLTYLSVSAKHLRPARFGE